MGSVKKVIAALVFEAVNWAAWEIAKDKGMIPETAQASYWVLITGILILMVIYWPEIWSWRKKPNGVSVAVPETNTWISKGDTEYLILESRIITRIKARHRRPRGYYSEFESMMRWANKERHGADAREEDEKKEIENAVKHALIEIEVAYPQVKNEAGEYSREIVERALLKMSSEL